jgi:hypothetical protein
MATQPPVCESRRAVFVVLARLDLGKAGSQSFGDPAARRPPAFQAVKIPFGNRALTMVSVWLEAKRRADSPRFDMLAGDAGLGFGGPPMRQNKALARTLVAARLRGNRQLFAPGGFGTLALRGYRL